MSILRPNTISHAVYRRKPAVNLVAYTLDMESALTARLSLVGDLGSQRPIGLCGPDGLDMPPFQASARVFTASELEAARWLETKAARVFKPARKSSRLARLMQRLN